ncbi:MAG: nickel pincer cofactor biosynthesis protein LarB [Terriglobales bacterium]
MASWTENSLGELLRQVATGTVEPEAALEQLRGLPFEDLGFARVDHHRQLRQGAAEVILGRGKTPQQVVAIAVALARHSPNLLITRADRAMAEAVQAALPGAAYHEIASLIVLEREAPPVGRGTILVVAAGTSDLAVAEEAALTASLLGGPVERLHDCGVAGLHRLLADLDRLQRAQVVIVAAGMDGALPSVVAGLVGAPVIAVPTSVGYGASFGGVAALLTMLNACAPNVTVVNIDNGFGAGFVAAAINRG